MPRDVSNVQRSVQTITFSTGLRSYTRASIQEIQVLHYRPFHGFVSGDDRLPTAESMHDSPSPSAEIVIFFNEQNSGLAGDISRVVIHRELPQAHFCPELTRSSNKHQEAQT